MIRALAFLLLLAAPAMAECPGVLRPPLQYSGTPRETIYPAPGKVSMFLPVEVVDWDCKGRDLAEIDSTIAYPTFPMSYRYLGCEWREAGKWHAELAEGPSDYERCRVLHMNGHVVEWELTGDANKNHVGWAR